MLAWPFEAKANLKMPAVACGFMPSVGNNSCSKMLDCLKFGDEISVGEDPTVMSSNPESAAPVTCRVLFYQRHPCCENVGEEDQADVLPWDQRGECEGSKRLLAHQSRYLGVMRQQEYLSYSPSQVDRGRFFFSVSQEQNVSLVFFGLRERPACLIHEEMLSMSACRSGASTLCVSRSLVFFTDIFTTRMSLVEHNSTSHWCCRLWITAHHCGILTNYISSPNLRQSSILLQELLPTDGMTATGNCWHL